MKTLEALFADAGALGLTLGKMFQTTYVLNSETRSDAWSAHFHDAHGSWFMGSGRTPYQAVANALKAETKEGISDEEMGLM